MFTLLLWYFWNEGEWCHLSGLLGLRFFCGQTKLHHKVLGQTDNFETTSAQEIITMIV